MFVVFSNSVHINRVVGVFDLQFARENIVFVQNLLQMVNSVERSTDSDVLWAINTGNCKITYT